MSHARVGEEPEAFVIWLTGLPSAGKTTIGRFLREELVERGVECELLDGDELRKTVSSNLGFSRADRTTHVLRVAEIADRLSRDGVCVVVAVIAPYEALRSQLRTLLGERYFEVYVNAPLALCESRDEKGLYRRARAGSIDGLTGIDDPYEVPAFPDLIVDTDGYEPSESVQQVLSRVLRLARNSTVESAA